MKTSLLTRVSRGVNSYPQINRLIGEIMVELLHRTIFGGEQCRRIGDNKSQTC